MARLDFEILQVRCRNCFCRCITNIVAIHEEWHPYPLDPLNGLLKNCSSGLGPALPDCWNFSLAIRDSVWFSISTARLRVKTPPANRGSWEDHDMAQDSDPKGEGEERKGGRATGYRRERRTSQEGLTFYHKN
jgi:hypothetical protein